MGVGFSRVRNITTVYRNTTTPVVTFPGGVTVTRTHSVRRVVLHGERTDFNVDNKTGTADVSSAHSSYWVPAYLHPAGVQKELTNFLTYGLYLYDSGACLITPFLDVSPLRCQELSLPALSKLHSRSYSLPLLPSSQVSSNPELGSMSHDRAKGVRAYTQALET